jgi:hypothetical protein
LNFNEREVYLQSQFGNEMGFRGVAQLASASGLGPEGPVFESQYPDFKKSLTFVRLFFCRGTLRFLSPGVADFQYWGLHPQTLRPLRLSVFVPASLPQIPGPGGRLMTTDKCQLSAKDEITIILGVEGHCDKGKCDPRESSQASPRKGSASILWLRTE